LNSVAIEPSPGPGLSSTEWPWRTAASKCPRLPSARMECIFQGESVNPRYPLSCFPGEAGDPPCAAPSIRGMVNPSLPPPPPTRGPPARQLRSMRPFQLVVVQERDFVGPGCAHAASDSWCEYSPHFGDDVALKVQNRPTERFKLCPQKTAANSIPPPKCLVFQRSGHSARPRIPILVAACRTNRPWDGVTPADRGPFQPLPLPGRPSERGPPGDVSMASAPIEIAATVSRLAPRLASWPSFSCATGNTDSSVWGPATREASLTSIQRPSSKRAPHLHRLTLGFTNDCQPSRNAKPTNALRPRLEQ